MENLDKKAWEPVRITKIFEYIEPGKCAHISVLKKENKGIPYIGATNRNNGILCNIEDTDKTRPLMQKGNCIGFVKDGDGSAGYAIYKFENFISTVNVIYGYAKWVNPDTGLFFVAAQDKIRSKYGFGYKRNLEHLRGDKVMLPVNKDNDPDYKYMEEYVRHKKKIMLGRYKAYMDKRLKELGNPVDIPSLSDKKWKSFKLTEIFNMIKRGKRLKKADHVDGNMPYVSSTALMNGNDGMCGNDKGTRQFKDCLTLANSGSVGSCFYHPYKFVASDHVTILKREDTSEMLYLGLSVLVSRLGEKYNFNREINDLRISRERIMLPVNDKDEPDFEYIEQYIKNLMLKKYQAYQDFYNEKR